jgi:hypothetical protein
MESGRCVLSALIGLVREGISGEVAAERLGLLSDDRERLMPLVAEFVRS